MCIFFADGNAQLSQPARWEEEMKFSDESYSIVSLKEEGLALLKDKEDYKQGQKLWDLIILDTALNQRWSTVLQLHEDLRFTGYEYIPGKVNLMFRKGSSDILRAEMIMLDLTTFSIQQSDTEVNLMLRLTHYTVVDGNSVFGGYVVNEPVLIIYDPIKDNNIIVPGFFLLDTELLDVRPNKNNTFNILLSQKAQGRKKIIFRTFDKMGNILVEDEISIDEEKTILTGAASVLEHDEVLIAGTYTFNNSKQASGIFSCLIDPFSEQPIQFTEFHQLRHFLDYMSPKKAGKIRGKATQRLNYGKVPEYRTNVDIHRIEEFKEGFALFGESYLMSSGTGNNTYVNPYGSSRSGNSFYSPYSSRYNNPYLNSPSYSYSELRMTEGFVVAFDFKGKRLWDYTIPMNEYKVEGREQVSDFTIIDQVPYFLFKEEDEIKLSNHSTDTLQINETQSIPIKLKSDLEQIRSNDDAEGNVRYWYGKRFYVWGIQSIKDLTKRNLDASRRVFFINTIQVD